MENLKHRFVLLINASTAPWFHGESAGPKIHWLPLSVALLKSASRLTSVQISLTSLLVWTNCEHRSENILIGSAQERLLPIEMGEKKSIRPWCIDCYNQNEKLPLGLFYGPDLISCITFYLSNLPTSYFGKLWEGTAIAAANATYVASWVNRTIEMLLYLQSVRQVTPKNPICRLKPWSEVSNPYVYKIMWTVPISCGLKGLFVSFTMSFCRVWYLRLDNIKNWESKIWSWISNQIGFETNNFNWVSNYFIWIWFKKISAEIFWSLRGLTQHYSMYQSSTRTTPL